jgi:hypothetical protein
MARKLVVLLAVGLVLAPAASAKGPHAVISSGPGAVEAGKPWLAKVQFNEFPRPSHPRVVASRGDRRIAVRLRPDQGARFKMRMVLPTDGRWHLSVVAGKLRFAFPAVAVGRGTAYPEYVGWPKGGGAEVPGGTALPPEVITVAEPRASEPSHDDGGLALWIPALGLALAGAGVGLGVVHRR